MPTLDVPFTLDAVRATKKSVSRSIDAAVKQLARLDPASRRAEELQAELAVLLDVEAELADALGEMVSGG